jgi:hypothetical protein
MQGREAFCVRNIFRGGNKSYQWDMKNHEGKKLENGAYSYRITTEGKNLCGIVNVLK